MRDIVLFFKWLCAYAFPYFVNHFIRGMKVTDHGEEFVAYLTKVIQDDYQPVSMQEQMFEEHLQRIKEKYYPNDSRKTVACYLAKKLLEFQWVPFSTIREVYNQE
nr:MAG TPA: hypothetical protein [Caudoviricetes sp.]